ncbi:uncharacterized protein LOC132755684 [Ruditapes philippinarum]|uniref:uncharacterized protein LOC132755684 n=1 Tax=Ruditapes philippinarum TaxID=129788 RepID=UPI00295BEE50|nr:uncharacterized protein LOC132755684 [Ruditapes philippinarum]
MAIAACLMTMCSFIVAANAKFDPVAFTVAQSTKLSFKNETTVPFTHITTNHMQRQDISGGVFTCKDGGVYKCQVYSLASPNLKTFLELWHNSQRVASLYGHVSGHNGAGGNSVVLDLNEGDIVQVKTRTNYQVDIFAYTNEIYNTFTCVQIGSEAISNSDNAISAFSVTSDRNQNVVGGASVLYDTQLVNINKGFNLDTGVYKALTAGIYIFHFFSLTHQNEELWQDLFQNDQYICSIKCVTDFDWTDAGNTAILHLNVNDTITVKAHAGIDNFLFGNPDQIFTTFSGVQVITDLDMLSPESFPVVAFSVALVNNISVSSGSTILYDHVFVNYKTSYNISTGHFVAPASGLYEFNYHGRTIRDSGIKLRLMQNQKYINSIYNVIPGHHATAGNAAVLELNGGDVVRIESQGFKNKLYGDPSEIYCTFSGYLLHAITPAEIIGK